VYNLHKVTLKTSMSSCLHNEQVQTVNLKSHEDQHYAGTKKNFSTEITSTQIYPILGLHFDTIRLKTFWFL